MTADPSNQPLLEVQGLFTQFQTAAGVLHAVNDVDFTVAEGEILGIVGESGSGKSVTALSIMDQVPSPGRVVSGTVRLGGQDLRRLSDRKMRRVRGAQVAMIFQDPMSSLNPTMRIGDQISEMLLVHRGVSGSKARSKTLELLGQVGIPAPAERAKQYPHQLSGGMRQRVMIAMALSCSPRLLIADEPTTALDVTIQAQILELIRWLRDEYGTAVITITHDLGVMAGLADRLAVMYAGRIVETGITSELFARPKHPYTRGLLRSTLRLDESRTARLSPIEGVPPDLIGVSRGCPFEPRCEFSEEKCRRENPLLMQVDAGHEAACWVTLPGPHSRASEPAILSESGVLKSTLLEVQQLTKTFSLGRGFLQRSAHTVVAVADVSFTIERGETLGLVGESGCGKSTLGRTILHLYKPTSGSVSFEGTDLTNLSEGRLRRVRRDMQVVFQDPYSSLDPRMRVGSLIAEPLKIHGLDEPDTASRVTALLDMVGLRPESALRYPHEFSGGQRQRIAIARAISVSPSFLVLDEPVSALDVSVQAQIINLLDELQRELDLTYLLIAHDLSLVRHISDRVAVMYLGEIVELAPRDQLYEQPLHPYTRALLSAVPIPDPDVEKQRARIILSGDLPSPAARPSGCAFRTRCHLRRELDSPEICEAEAPPLRQLGTGHTVACHFAEELISEPSPVRLVVEIGGPDI